MGDLGEDSWFKPLLCWLHLSNLKLLARSNCFATRFALFTALIPSFTCFHREGMHASYILDYILLCYKYCTQLHMQHLAWFVICCIAKAFFKEYVFMHHGIQCFNCTHPIYDVYDYTSGDKRHKTLTNQNMPKSTMQSFSTVTKL